MAKCEKRCENCANWDLANALPAEFRLRTRHDDDYEPIRPPHADLNWSHCSAAVEGFDNHDEAQEAKLYGGKMAVFDGSSYAAELWTRFDHICGEWRERE